VNPDDPTASSRLHPATVYVGVVSAVAGSIVPVLVTAFVGAWTFTGFILFGAVIAAVISTIGNVVRYRSVSYRVTPDEIIIDEGVVEKTHRVIPFRRIQNLRVEQGLGHRLLKVATVQVETAGSSGPEARLVVIGVDEARGLRATVLRNEPGDANSENSVEPLSRLLRKVKLWELIAGGLTSQFSTLIIGVLGVLPLFFPQLDILPSYLFDPFDALEELPQRFGWQQNGILAIVLRETAFKSLVFIFGGLLIAMIGYVFLWFGFRLQTTQDMLTWEYGLFTRQSGGIPKKRVQLLKIEEPLFRRCVGLATLKADTGGDQSESSQDKTGRGVLLPILPSRELLPLVGNVLSIVSEPVWHRVSPLAVRRGTIKGYLALMLAMTLLCSFLGWYLLWAIALAPLIYFLNLMAYRHTGYSLDSHLFAYRRGWLNRSTRLVPVRHVQAAGIYQSPFDRRLGLASVLVDTTGQTHTGGMPLVRHLPVEEARSLVQQLLNPPRGRRRD
jgi:putative membrane protein